MARDIHHQIKRGVAWIGLASSITALLDIATSLALLRWWVTQAEYGIAGLAVPFFPMLDLATDMGLSSAVIQRDDHTPERISTVFWLNVGVSLVIFGVLCGVGPLLAYLRGRPIVAWLFIAYGAKIIFQNTYFIPAAMMRRELRFKELSVIRICANVTESTAKLAFAAAGWPIWCFVLGPLCRSVVTCVGIQICHPWRPRFVLRLRDARDYVRFGLRTSASQILFHLYTNVDYWVVSGFFGDRANGLYKAAYDLVLDPVKFISNVVVDIAFPTFARLRHEGKALIDQFIAFTRQNLLVVLPFLVIVMLAAEEIFTLVLPDWTAASGAARVLCVVGVLRGLSFVVPPLLDGIGSPQTTLRYTVVASVVLPASFIGFAWGLGDRYGYVSVAIAWAVGYPIAFAVLAWLGLTKIKLTPAEYLRRVRGIPGCTAVAAVVGVVARALTPAAWSAGPRLLAIAAPTLVTLGVLLAYVEGISPRSVLRGMAGKPEPPPGESGQPPAEEVPPA